MITYMYQAFLQACLSTYLFMLQHAPFFVYRINI